MPESDQFLPDDVRREMRREARLPEFVRERVMAAVRRDAALARRGGWLSPLVGGALAAGIALATVGGAVLGSRQTADASAALPIAGAALEASIRDTLLLMRFAITAPRASRVALVGDFNRWDRGATPLARASDASRAGVWTAEVALSRGDHRYAFVIDDSQWVAGPAAGVAPAAPTRASRPVTRSVSPTQE